MTAEKALSVYLNDHLAGAVLGCDLAQYIHAQSEDLGVTRTPGTEAGAGVSRKLVR